VVVVMVVLVMVMAMVGKISKNKINEYLRN
jgi:hypothetical protein